MGRRKHVIIELESLDIYDDLLAELKKLDVNSEWDFGSFRIVGSYKYQPKTRVVPKMVANIERYIQINGNKRVLKTELCDIAQISRPTLDRLLDENFLCFSALGRSYSLFIQQFDKLGGINKIIRCPPTCPYSHYADPSLWQGKPGDEMKKCLSQQLEGKDLIPMRKWAVCQCVMDVEYYTGYMRYNAIVGADLQNILDQLKNIS